MTQIIFSIDKETDIHNWYEAANSSSYGNNIGKSINSDILEKLQGKTKDEAIQILGPIIKKRYLNPNYTKVTQDLTQWRAIHGDQFFNKMENIVGRPIPPAGQTLKAIITTNGRCPYNSSTRSLLYCPTKQGGRKTLSDSVGIVMHELLHMMVHYYYQQYILDSGLTLEEFHVLKESQTVILNEEYGESLGAPDIGYNSHKDIREKLKMFRQQNKNFDDFIDYGITTIKERKHITNNNNGN